MTSIMDQPRKEVKSPRQNFFDHVDELRGRVIKSIVVYISCAFLSYFFIDELLVMIIQPVGKLVFTTPAEAFMTRIMLAFFCGALLAMPFFLFQVWAFVYSGLKEHERKYVMSFGPMSIVLFFAGCVFSYWVTIPVSLRFLLSFSSEQMVPMITVKNYISFVGTLLIAFGVIFELPLVLFFLTRIGVATPAFLVQKRKYAVVFIMIVSALLTPPDVITQLIMAGPLILLYEIGILASKWTYKEQSI